MQYCDHGHQANETRVLPIGAGGNLILCKRHYLEEIRWRKMRNDYLDPANHFDLPEWESLTLYDGR